MTDIVLPPPELFLRDDVIRGGMDLMFFAHSRHLRHVDEELAKRGLGRAHHRLLYFVGRKPGSTVSELLALLGVTKQSFGRVAKDLIDRGLMMQRAGERDRRTRLLSLTPEGDVLERELFADLRANMVQAYAASGGTAVAGFWTVMQNLMGEEARVQFRGLANIGF